mmetsp:Transcript_35957/g.76778  ORF Transcript_35957/g.76778 Transcript_35957/m.76778 type:complete len:230 (+) Transcript_35957:632-1321(+)
MHMRARTRTHNARTHARTHVRTCARTHAQNITQESRVQERTVQHTRDTAARARAQGGRKRMEMDAPHHIPCFRLASPRHAPAQAHARTQCPQQRALCTHTHAPAYALHIGLLLTRTPLLRRHLDGRGGGNARGGALAGCELTGMCPSRAGEVGVGDGRFDETSLGEGRPDEGGVADVGHVELGQSAVGRGKIGARQVGTEEARLGELGAGEVGPVKFGHLEGGEGELEA